MYTPPKKHIELEKSFGLRVLNYLETKGVRVSSKILNDQNIKISIAYHEYDKLNEIIVKFKAIDEITSSMNLIKPKSRAEEAINAFGFIWSFVIIFFFIWQLPSLALLSANNTSLGNWSFLLAMLPCLFAFKLFISDNKKNSVNSRINAILINPLRMKDDLVPNFFTMVSPLIGFAAQLGFLLYFILTGL